MFCCPRGFPAALLYVLFSFAGRADYPAIRPDYLKLRERANLTPDIVQLGTINTIVRRLLANVCHPS